MIMFYGLLSCSINGIMGSEHLDEFSLSVSFH